MSGKSINNNIESSGFAWFLIVCMVLFWNWDGNEHDLYDLIYDRLSIPEQN